MTALENVLLPLELAGQRCSKTAKNWLEKVGLTDRLGHYPRQLSGGEQQRIGIARAVVNKPSIFHSCQGITGTPDNYQTWSRIRYQEQGRESNDYVIDVLRDKNPPLLCVVSSEEVDRHIGQLLINYNRFSSIFI